MRQSYRSDLTDEQWEVIRTLIPPAKTGGRPRTVDMRGVVDEIFYINEQLTNPLECRRLNKDYEVLPATSETMIRVAMIRLMLRRLA